MHGGGLIHLVGEFMIKSAFRLQRCHLWFELYAVCPSVASTLAQSQTHRDTQQIASGWSRVLANGRNPCG